MGWARNKIINHIRAVKLLEEVLAETANFIQQSKKITEFEVQGFILKLYKSKGLHCGKIPPIVAFGKNTSFVHYYPARDSRILRRESLVLIDIFAKIKGSNSPFADITWMYYHGNKMDEKISNVFNMVIKARDLATDYIVKKLRKKQMPTGSEVDLAVRNFFASRGYKKEFKHGLGHSLGFSSPHGKEGGLKRSNQMILKRNLGYTIEPGIYIKNRFGVRSEIDFFINNNYQMILTAKKQYRVVML